MALFLSEVEMVGAAAAAEVKINAERMNTAQLNHPTKINLTTSETLSFISLQAVQSN